MPLSATAVRPAAVAGAFYPGNALQLAQQVDALLSQAASERPPTANAGGGLERAHEAAPHVRPKALIVPHAGYAYSGPVAATAYAAVAAMNPKPTSVVLLGPSHHVGFKGVALPGTHALATPLGLVEVDERLVDLALRFPFVGSSPLAHKREHSLEVQLPFLQRALGSFKVLPMIVGHVPAEDIAALLSSVWGGPETLVVVSSDLSHYLSFDEARATDASTAERIGALDAEHLSPEQICGAEPVRGLLVAAREHHLSARVLDLRNSGDTAGNRSRVVGYGAFAFTSSENR